MTSAMPEPRLILKPYSPPRRSMAGVKEREATITFCHTSGLKVMARIGDRLHEVLPSGELCPTPYGTALPEDWTIYEPNLVPATLGQFPPGTWFETEGALAEELFQGCLILMVTQVRGRYVAANGVTAYNLPDLPVVAVLGSLTDTKHGSILPGRRKSNPFTGRAVEMVEFEFEGNERVVPIKPKVGYPFKARPNAQPLPRGDREDPDAG